MKVLRPALLLAGTVVLLVSNAAGQAQPSSEKQLRTFVAADGSFTFKYPANMFLCQPDPAVVNGWSPEWSCDGYAPICRDPAAAPNFTTLACVAVAASPYKESNFEAAGFSILEAPTADMSSCLPKIPDGFEMIGGIRFAMIHGVGYGLGHAGDVYQYRTIHDGRCYQLAITVSTSSFGNWTPGTKRKFTKADRTHVISALRNVMQSFRFVH